MPILKYTTQVNFHTTIGEIASILAKHGARKISTHYNEKQLPVAVDFELMINGHCIRYQLPCNYVGVQLTLQKSNIAHKYKNEEQALRVAWRIVKTWVEAQMAMLEAKLATMPELFFQYAQLHNGNTIYNEFLEKNFKLLES